MKEILQRGGISFAISAFAGLLVNLTIDTVANACGQTGFTSIAPEFLAMFPTPAIAAYVNIILYGLIGSTYASMTFIYDCKRIGYLIQSVIYFVVTAAVSMGITVLLWQLHHYPAALISTMSGYALTFVIMETVHYKKLREDIRIINKELAQ